MAPQPADAYPWVARVRAARRFARRRAGRVSFAVVDEDGRRRSVGGQNGYRAASVIKAMFLATYLRRRDVRSRRLRASEKRLLGPMIRISDNASATAIRHRIGALALRRLARRAGMLRFRLRGHWGLSRITASDQARFFFRLDGLLPRRHRRYAKRLLRRIVPYQRWGIPHARPPRGWGIHFKAGWLGGTVHQVAMLQRGRRHISLAVLTDGNPSFVYGQLTIRGVARRLLRGYPR